MEICNVVDSFDIHLKWYVKKGCLECKYNYHAQNILLENLAFFHRGQGGAPLRQFTLLRDFCPSPPPEIWSKNNRKINIAKEICITIDFAPLKKFLEESQKCLFWTR